MTPQELYRRYVWAGAMTRNADALADLFADDGVLESPLVPADHDYPRRVERVEGREQIRAAMAAYYQRSANDHQAADIAESRYVLHDTSDPGVFIAEVDAVINGPAGTTTVSLVQIFRVRDGKITSLRDYFAPGIVS